jgi:Zn-dependent protease/CBS domain-containing protein
LTGRGILVGTAFGIPLRVDYSWFLILFLLTALLSGSLGQSFPYLGLPARVSLALSASLLLFGSVLAHELSHALVAVRNGVGIRGITLFVFGGAAEMLEEPRTPGAELRIALAGPLMSLFLALAFVFVYWAALGSAPLPLVAMALQLSQMNLLLVACNVVPGFPLDGGRVLRAALWGIWGNPVAATRVAAALGSFFGGFVILLGLIWIFLLGNPIGGLWFLLIGFFLRRAAGGAFQQILVQRALEGVTARDVMNRDVPFVAPHMSLLAAVEDVILPRGVSEIAVVDEGRFLGVLGLARIRERDRSTWPGLTVRDLVSLADAPDAVAPDADAFSLLVRLSAEDRLLPVVEGEELLGVITRDDLVRRLQVRLDLASGRSS